MNNKHVFEHHNTVNSFHSNSYPRCYKSCVRLICNEIKKNIIFIKAISFMSLQIPILFHKKKQYEQKD